MKKLFLIALMLIVAKTDFAQTFISYPSGKKSSDKPIYYREGNTMKSYPSGNTSFVIEGNEIKNYSFGNIVYYLEGQNVKEFPSGNILFVIDGDKVKNPSGETLYYKEENKIKRYSDGKMVSDYENWGSPLWILVCLINTGC